MLTQHRRELPAYVPLIQYASRRINDLPLPLVAITTFRATQRCKKTRDMERDPIRFRARYRLAPNALVLLSSIAKDDALERYWRNRHRHDLIAGIKAVDPAHVIAPNFSLFHDVPRLDNLANIKRSLLCAEELSKAGVSIIPYVGGIAERDWERWVGFLREHTTIRLICKEFQTGPSSTVKGAWHIARLEELQQRLGRSLDIVAVGGRRHRSQLGSFRCTIIDSVPFMRTMYRRALTNNTWAAAPTTPDTPLDNLLMNNIKEYAKRIEAPPTERLRATPVRPQNDQLLLWQTPDAA